ncbi:MAG: hypothetical protein ACI837_001325 [Crocinitomicaceae bacterium]|jgi:hypothetical protein
MTGQVLKLTAIFILISLSSFDAYTQENGDNKCNGKARRSIKLLADSLAHEIDTNRILISIKEYGELDVPKVSRTTPRHSSEKKVYTMRGSVTKIKRYMDGDYHILISDDYGNHVITEIPNPNCEYARDSPFRPIYEKWFHRMEEESFIELGDQLEVTGVAFIDLDHHIKRKQAPNHLEIHPILEMKRVE